MALEVEGAYMRGDSVLLRKNDCYPRCIPKSHLLILKLVNSECKLVIIDIPKRLE
jgi:hypothetical protein